MGISYRSGNIMGAFFVLFGLFGQEYRLVGVLSLSGEREPPCFPVRVRNEESLIDLGISRNMQVIYLYCVCLREVEGNESEISVRKWYSVEMKAHKAHIQVNYTHSCSCIHQAGGAVFFWSLESEEITVKHIKG